MDFLGVFYSNLIPLHLLLQFGPAPCAKNEYAAMVIYFAASPTGLDDTVQPGMLLQ